MHNLSTLPVILILLCSSVAIAILAITLSRLPGISAIEAALGVTGSAGLLVLLRIALEG